jgi:thiol:disulfide interchange protein
MTKSTWILALMSGLWTIACGPAPLQTQQPSDQSADWLVRYDEALQTAARENKPVLINFTGSDWCPPCQQLKREVFSTPQFQEFAAGNLILLELDFPRRKQLEPELVRQNAELQSRYNIEGFPTVILVSPDGKERKRHVGHRPGGPAAYLRWIES